MTAPQTQPLAQAADHPPVAARREDVLVSVCFGELPVDAETLNGVAALARQLDARFRFREIVVVAEESSKDALLALVRRVDNLRLLTVRDGMPFYRRRVIAADEAIGDVVIVANAAELPHLDAVAMIEQAADDQQMVLAARAAGLIDRTLAGPLVALGRLAGFKVSLRDMQTMAVPRTLLNQLLAHPDPDLALRFPPRDVRLPLAFAAVAPGMPSLREVGQQGRRLALLQKLLVYVAPSVLMAVTLASALLAVTGFLYAFYVLGAWIVVEDLAQGWLTLSAMLSLTAFFLGVSIMGLSLGLQQLLARVGREGFDGVATEVNRIDLFGHVASDLNVELEREAADASEPTSR
jgi:hypothetical protein